MFSTIAPRSVSAIVQLVEGQVSLSVVSFVRSAKATGIKVSVVAVAKAACRRLVMYFCISTTMLEVRAGRGVVNYVKKEGILWGWEGFAASARVKGMVTHPC